MNRISFSSECSRLENNSRSTVSSADCSAILILTTELLTMRSYVNNIMTSCVVYDWNMCMLKDFSQLSSTIDTKTCNLKFKAYCRKYLPTLVRTYFSDFFSVHNQCVMRIAPGKANWKHEVSQRY